MAAGVLVAEGWLSMVLVQGRPKGFIRTYPKTATPASNQSPSLLTVRNRESGSAQATPSAVVPLTPTTVVPIHEGEDIKCPVCGTVAVSADGDCTLPPCEHIRFIYFGGGGAFVYAEPGLEDWFESQMEELEDDFDTEEVLQKYVAQDGLMLERLVESLACGPVSIAIWVGIRSARLQA
jgi:hypothetical protein